MKKYVMICVVVFAAFFCLTASASGADWYTCFVYKIIPYANGSVKVQFTPGTEELSFTGKARATIQATVPGANKMMATLLSAMIEGWEVSVYTDDVPDWNDIQVVRAVGLVSP